MRAIKPKKTLVDQTYDILEEAIFSGDLLPGQRLAQEEIATQLNVSRQPVIHAITMLKANGLVEDIGRRGVVVSEISKDQFISIYEFRTAIEPFAVRMAYKRMPKDAAKQAESIMQRGWDAVHSKNAQAQVETDMAFHEMIYSWAGNQTIVSTMRMNWHHIRRGMSAVVREGISAATSWEEHARVIDTLLNGDVEQSVLAMKRHIENAQAKTLAVLEMQEGNSALKG